LRRSGRRQADERAADGLALPEAGDDADDQRALYDRAILNGAALRAVGYTRDGQ
jgi:hypothetical protein